MCFTSARNIVTTKLSLVLILCACVWLRFNCVSLQITHINTGFVCVYFEFTLSSSTCWTQNGFKSAHREYANFQNTRQYQFPGQKLGTKFVWILCLQAEFCSMPAVRFKIRFFSHCIRFTPNILIFTYAHVDCDELMLTDFPWVRD